MDNIDAIVERLLAVDKFRHEGLEKILDSVPLEEFPAIIGRLMAKSQKLETSYVQDVERWTDQGAHASHSMQDYGDNEVAVSHRAFEENQRKINGIIGRMRNYEERKRGE